MDCELSAYFRQLDAACEQRSAIEQALTNPTAEGGTSADIAPAAASLAREVLAYCQDRTRLPELASAGLSERASGLREVAALGGALPALDAVKVERTVDALHESAVSVLDGVAARTAPDSTLQGGAGTDFLVQQLLGQVCSSAGVAAWLPAVCAPLTPGDALIQLRQRLVRDLVFLPERAAERQGLQAKLPPEARATLALLAAATSTHAPQALALQLAEAAGSQAEAWCRANDAAPPGSDSLVLAGYLLLRLLADGAALERDDAYYERVIAKTFQRAQRPLSPSALRASQGLVRALRRLGAGGAPRSAEEVAQRFDALTQTLDALLSLVLGRQVVIPASGSALGKAILAADLEGMSRQALLVARDLRLAQLSESEANAIETAVRFSLARDEDEAKRIVRGLLIPLGRWSESVLFDLNGDVPKLSDGDFKIVGDALLGYNGKSWGISGQGSIASYDFSTPTNIAVTDAFDAGLEVWLASGAQRELKLELRLFARFAFYETSHGGSAAFSDESSSMGRLGLLASVRYQPGERFAGGLWLGAGGQYEEYDNGRFANRTANLESTDSLGLLLNGRLRAELAIVPRWFATRLRVEAQRYSLQRESLETVAGGGSVSVDAQTVSAQQTEVRARLFLDAEVARFAGFVPGLNAGFDAVYFSSDEEQHSAFVPVFGAGVRRDAF